MLLRTRLSVFRLSAVFLTALSGCATIAPVPMPSQRAPGIVPIHASAQLASQPASQPAIVRVAATRPTIPIVELSGSPREIGLAHGKQLSEQIHVLQDKYLNVMLADPKARMVAMYSATTFEKYMTPDQREEITALAEGSGVDRQSILLAQCFLDLRSSVACSTISFPAEASRDGVPRMGRNLDFPSLDVADKMSALLIVRPTGRNAFAAVSWPGLIGVLSGMNEKGLCLANMEIARPMRFPTAMPYTLLYRTILENCTTVDDAIALLEKAPRQTSNNLMLMDAAGNRAVIEITPEQIAVRRGTDGAALISTNHQRGQDTGTAGYCWRYDLLHARSAQQFGDIGVAQIEAMLKAAQQADWTIQSMVFEPSTRTIYLATGKRAADHAFERIQLFH
jgi:isopenicillin-N N-acyltransferase like protein